MASSRSPASARTAAGTPPVAPAPWAALAATTGVQALVSMAALTPPVFGALATAAVGLPSSAIGYYTSVVYFGAMLTSLFSGAPIARWGAMRVSQVCLLLCCGGLAVLAATQGGALLVLAVAGALVIGLGYGPVTPASSHILARSTPARRRNLVFSVKQTGVPIGGMLAGALVPWLVGIGGWRGAALAVGLAAAALALLVQPTRRGLDGDRQPGKPLKAAAVLAPLGLIWRHRPLRLLALSSFTFAAMQLCLSTFLVTYLIERVALSLVDAGLLLAVAQGAGIGGRILWGIVADRWLGPRPTLLGLGALVALSALATAWVVPALPWAGMALVAATFGATAIGWNGVYLAEVAHLAPSGRAGEATGGALFFTYAGVICGPSLFGAAVTLLPGGYASAFTLFGLAALGGGVLAGLAGARRADGGGAASGDPS